MIQEKKFYTKEEIQAAREVNLYDYLSSIQPGEMKHVSGNEYMLANDSYIRIDSKTGAWIDYANNTGGYSAIDYLIKNNNYTLPQAVSAVIGNISFVPEKKKEYIQHTPKEKKSFMLPEKADNNERIKKYLIEKRGLDKDIVNLLIQSGQVYEEKKFHNCVFVGYDNNKHPAYAMLRGTLDKRFVGEVGGSDKRCGFSMFRGKEENKVLCVFESAIDAISYASLLKAKNKPWTKISYVSLGGAAKPGENKEASEMPPALEYTLKSNKHYSDIILCLDKDAVGIKSTENLSELLKQKGYNVSRFDISHGKDINDMLLAFREEQKIEREL